MKTEPKPCPFCGAQAEVCKWHGSGRGITHVGCSNDHCPVIPGCVAGTRSAAIEKWNTRAGGSHD